MYFENEVVTDAAADHVDAESDDDDDAFVEVDKLRNCQESCSPSVLSDHSICIKS